MTFSFIYPTCFFLNSIFFPKLQLWNSVYSSFFNSLLFFALISKCSPLLRQPSFLLRAFSLHVTKWGFYSFFFFLFFLTYCDVFSHKKCFILWVFNWGLLCLSFFPHTFFNKNCCSEESGKKWLLMKTAHCNLYIFVCLIIKSFKY